MPSIRVPSRAVSRCWCPGRGGHGRASPPCLDARPGVLWIRESRPWVRRRTGRAPSVSLLATRCHRRRCSPPRQSPVVARSSDHDGGSPDLCGRSAPKRVRHACCVRPPAARRKHQGGAAELKNENQFHPCSSEYKGARLLHKHHQSPWTPLRTSVVMIIDKCPSSTWC